MVMQLLVESQTGPEDGGLSSKCRAFQPFQALKTGPCDVLRFLLKKSQKVSYTFQTLGQCIGQRLEFPDPP